MLGNGAKAKAAARSSDPLTKAQRPVQSGPPTPGPAFLHLSAPSGPDRNRGVSRWPRAAAVPLASRRERHGQVGGPVVETPVAAGHEAHGRLPGPEGSRVPVTTSAGPESAQ